MKVKKFVKSHLGKKTQKLATSIAKNRGNHGKSRKNTGKNRKRAISDVRTQRNIAASVKAGPSRQRIAMVKNRQLESNTDEDGDSTVINESLIDYQLERNIEKYERKVLQQLVVVGDEDATSGLECTEELEITHDSSHSSLGSESSRATSDSAVEEVQSHPKSPLHSFSNFHEPHDMSERVGTYQQPTSTQNEALNLIQRRMPTQMQHNASYDSEEMWRLMCAKSKVYMRSSHMLDDHPEILLSMRTILFDWMMDVCQAEKLHRETFYMSMEYVDRFLTNTKNLPSSKLQLFGTVAIHVACKFEEVYPPKLKTLVSYTDGACEADEVRDAERIMLKFLSWLLNPLTAVHWLGVYLVLLGRVDNENADAKQWRIAETGVGHGKIYNLLCESTYDFSKVMRTTFVSMAQVLDLCMLDPRSIQYDYAELAAAVLWCFFEPNELIEEITGFQMEQLHSVCMFVEPYTYVWERRQAPGQPLPVFEGIDASDIHNIQTHIDDYESWMAEADEIRAKMSQNELHHKRVNVVPVTLSGPPFSSPRPLAELQNTSAGSPHE